MVCSLFQLTFSRLLTYDVPCGTLAHQYPNAIPNSMHRHLTIHPPPSVHVRAAADLPAGGDGGRVGLRVPAAAADGAGPSHERHLLRELQQEAGVHSSHRPDAAGGEGCGRDAS